MKGSFFSRNTRLISQKIIASWHSFNHWFFTTPERAILEAYQAAQARLSQGVETRGGVGAAQVATQLAMLRNELIQNQYDYGLKILGIGDNIALGAIKTGLEADRYVNELTGNYFKNIAATVYGSSVQPPRA